MQHIPKYILYVTKVILASPPPPPYLAATTLHVLARASSRIRDHGARYTWCCVSGGGGETKEISTKNIGVKVLIMKIGKFVKQKKLKINSVG